MVTAVSMKTMRLMACGVLACLSLAGCGGGGGGGDGPFAISGSISGLVGTVVLQNNGGDNLSGTADGKFSFATAVAKGGAYNVTVLTQPAGQTCTIANPSGRANGKVFNVFITCVSFTYNLGGTVSGLSGTVVLAENDQGDSVAVSIAGNYQFPQKVSYGDTYHVSVYKQPLGQTCTVTGIGNGTVTGDVGNVTVSCVNNPYTIGGNVTGLTTGTVRLALNFADGMSVSNGPFTFAKPLPAGAVYAVSSGLVSTAFGCVVTNGIGVANAAVTNVTVTCTPLPATVSLGGNVQGLATGATVTLRNSVTGETATRSANGTFTFPTAVTLGTEYLISVQTQPTGQTCTVVNATGLAATNSAAIMTVNCASVTETHTVGGTVTGLKAPMRLGITLNNAFLDISPPASGPASFTFPIALQTDAQFQVYVWVQPAGQTCLIPHSGSHVAHADLTDITVVCVDNTTDPLAGTYRDTSGDFVLTLYAAGMYVFASTDDDSSCGTSKGNGVEMGVYHYNAAANTLAFISNVLDTNGSTCGVWRNGASIVNGTLVKTGAGQSSVLTLTPMPGQDPVTLVPVASETTVPAGSFVLPGSLSFLVFGNDGRYWEVNTNDDPAFNAPAGIEHGCFSFTGNLTGTLTTTLDSATCADPVDTDNTAGLSGSSGVSASYSTNTGFIILGNSTIGFRVLPN